MCVCSLLGVSYAELRYEVPSLGSKPDTMETSYNGQPPSSGHQHVYHTELSHSNTSSMQGGRTPSSLPSTVKPVI